MHGVIKAVLNLKIRTERQKFKRGAEFHEWSLVQIPLSCGSFPSLKSEDFLP
jgi:hypothetical protein